MIKIKSLIALPFYLIFLGMMFTSCQSDRIYTDIVEVNYGTSFGMCVGYCKREMSLKPGLVTYRCSGWSDTIQPLTQTGVLNDTTWNALNLNLEVNPFFNLTETLGCPDCADGGAEWLEIKLANGNSHKVTFEYQNEPVLLKVYIPKLREMMKSQNCGE